MTLSQPAPARAAQPPELAGEASQPLAPATDTVPVTETATAVGTVPAVAALPAQQTVPGGETVSAGETVPAGGAELPTRLRAVDPLLIELSEAAGDKVIVSSPRLPARLRVGPAVAQILIAARSGLRTADHPRHVLARLTQAGFLVDAEAEPTPAGPPWNDWGTTAWNFYARIKDTSFVSTDPGQLAEYRSNFARRPRPPSVRAPVSDRILLPPRVRSALDAPYREVLENRRTHRYFEDQPMDLDAFSDLLHYTFAPLRFVDS